MRKIKSNFFVSLDGVVESRAKWRFPYFDHEMGAAIGAGVANVGAYLMGRVLYEVGGDDGERLHKWAYADGESGQPSGPTREFQDEWEAAGAVLSGRRTAELMDLALVE